MSLTEAEAKTRRTSIKGSVTRLKTFLESAQALRATKFELIERKKKLAELFEQYDEVQSRLECLAIDKDTTVTAAYVEDRARFEEAYFQLMSLHEQRINVIEQSQIESRPSTSVSNQVVTSQHNSDSNIRLPKIQLPTFSGSYEEWYTFHDSFDKLIHANEKLSSIQKFHYLRSSLKDKAAEVIKSFDITTDNYAEAWQLLSERFDNKRRIVQTHIKAIFEIAPIHKENCTALRVLLDNVLKHFRALKALQRPVDTWDDVMVHLVLTKLDSTTIKEWETSRTDTTIPTFRELTDFLAKRCQALETISNKSTGRVNSDVTNNSQKAKYPIAHVVTNNQSCIHCKGKHLIFQCESFRNLPVERRFEVAKNAHLCINCLKAGSHQAKNCTASSCRKCGKTHNTLLHFEAKNEIAKKDQQQTASLSKANESSSDSPSPVVTQCTQMSNACNVLLATAIVSVYDSRGQTHGCKVLLDSGSQLNFITENFANKLQLNVRDFHISMSGAAEGQFESKRIVNVTFRSRVNAYTKTIECIILHSIIQRIPQEFHPMSDYNIPSNLALADPNFNIPSDIDMLIGAPLFWPLLCVGQIKSCKAHPTLQKTKLGWVVGGPSFDCSNIATPVCHVTAVDKLNDSISKFWEVEHDISSANTAPRTLNEQLCETHFQQNVRRNKEGRFIVKLPVNEEKIQQLGDSMEIARRRFLNLERRLTTQPAVYLQYKNFMREYINLNHMREIKDLTNDKLSYYLPHHTVIKESSTTTKLRVVFDASCRTTSGLSLNDTLLAGPTVQDDLFSILTRFRIPQYAMTADVCKMYRQVLIDESQTCFQRIFWRESPQDDLKGFELLTLTYGTVPASFLAIRTIRKLAEDEAESFPIGSKVTLRDFYVDDLLTGASTLKQALKIKEQATELLNRGGFELTKWSSNHASLRDSKVPCSKEFSLAVDHSNETRALGVSWNCESDIFKFTSIGHHQPLEKPTKRSILSRIALIFDPLGLLGPSVIIAKLLMQELWRSKLDWDESISNESHTLWREYEGKLQILRNIGIPRMVVCNEMQNVEIHGFSDASQQAYGACLYVKSISRNGQVEVRLLCSKSRVAPLKALSIPRLELCGALLLAQLTLKVRSCLPVVIRSMYFWTDSRIVLCWLRSCSRKWTPFVANRIAEIQRLTDISDWRHVPSLENSADPLSRGVMPDLLGDLDIWWFGPSWLKLNENEWPSENFHTSDIELPEGRVAALVSGIEAKPQYDIFNRFSKFSRLIRVVAFCHRFTKNCKIKGIKMLHVNNKDSVKVQPLTIEELEQSRIALVRLVQHDAFKAEMHSIKVNRCLNKNSNILRLKPFIDMHGILRVGGRLVNADISYQYKHPILLPGKHAFTQLIIKYEHERHLHAGAQATLSAIRQNYWPTSARSTVRSMIKKCVTCVRNAPTLSNTLMADLPETRVRSVKYVFQKCGVDYAGPFLYKEGQRKNSKTVKCYIALFICLATKAVHIELAADLSSETYLNVFKRFMSRRGRPTDIYSDNGLNFVGAKRELNELYELFKTDSLKQKIVDFMALEKIKWHFIPPRAPHMGGIWEAAIKSTKFHLKRIIGEASLKHDELLTLLTQVEAILNSRPLTPLSNDPSDLNALTPAHFLIGCPITAYPEPSLETLPINKLSRWQRVEKLKQHFWRRWVKEYLHTCQSRTKWNTISKPIKIGQMILLQEDNLPLLCWSLGRIEQIHPGDDGVVRVATVRTPKGVYKRPITRLCVLPVEE
ncbi:uncharacterized protein LOC120359860 [Solenopsis invicta]|nr:uncharacterized protein LOC120359860 [Solenopsis invicta]